MRFFVIGLFIFIFTACTPVPPAPPAALPSPVAASARLAVAWVQQGNLIVWQEGEAFPRRIASGGVVRPYLSPTAEHVLFTRGANSNPETLWAVDFAGIAEQQLVGGERPDGYQAGADVIGDVVWYDATTYYFNTLSQRTAFYEPRHDLYRGSIHTREVTRLLPPLEGGRPVLSPDGQWVALLFPGTYGNRDGVIRVVDALAQQAPQGLLNFVGVATGAELPFYPPVQWLPDSSALLVAIPDPDLLYSETTDAVPETSIWRVPIRSGPELLNTIQASFFGLPRWSDDARAMTFLQRTASSNRVTLFVGDRSGDNPTPYYMGALGETEQARWIADTQGFFYTQGAPGTVFVGGPGIQTQRLALEPILAAQFVNADTYVYATPEGDGFLLKVGRLDATAQIIAEVGAGIPLWDARFVGAS